MIPAGIVPAEPVALYCKLYKQSKLAPLTFARHARIRWPELCLAVLETIGSWPSSEPELAALQLVGP